METTKEKVNVKEIMQRAKAKTEAVAKSTEAVKAKTEDFRIIPGFSKYEFNGTIVRNVKTKYLMSLKKNGKYQLLDDKGKNCDRSKDQIKELLPIKVKVEKQIKEPKLKKEKVQGGEKKLSKLFSVSLFMHQGKTKEQIMNELGISEKQYSHDSWYYAHNGYKERVEKYLKENSK